MAASVLVIEVKNVFLYTKTGEMAKETAVNSSSLYSILATGTKIVGSIDTDYDLRLDGSLDGDIVCGGKLVMGAQSALKGTIRCINAEILGKVEANVDTKELLILRSQAEITGDIKTSTLMIEPGAVLNGTCSMAGSTKQD